MHLHTPHLGATALPVEVDADASLPDGSASLSATASRSDHGLAITLINRHLSRAAEVCVETATPGLVRPSARLLAAASPRATNSAETPDGVVPVDLAVAPAGSGAWRLELPPHALATLVLS